MRPAWPFCGPVALLCRDIGREDDEKNKTAGDSGQANEATNMVGFAWDDEQEKESNTSEAWITLVQVSNAGH